MVHKLHVSSPYNVNTSLQKPYNTCVVTCKFELIKLRYDLPNGFTYLQLGRDFKNLFYLIFMPF